MTNQYNTMFGGMAMQLMDEEFFMEALLYPLYNCFSWHFFFRTFKQKLPPDNLKTTTYKANGFLFASINFFTDQYLIGVIKF